MNTLLHFFFNFLVVESVWHNAHEYVWWIAAFSMCIDLDHLPYLSSIRWKVRSCGLGAKSRSRFHELFGLALFSLVIAVYSFFGSLELLKVVALSFVLHLAMDFVIGHTRPFFPFSDRVVFLNVLPVKYRMLFEVVATVVFGVWYGSAW